MTRLFISDIDGTLVRKDKTLTEPTVAAIKRLRAAGVPVTLISARPPSGIVAHAERLGIDLPLGAFNGGTIFRPDGTILSAARLPAAIATDALDRLRAAGIERWVFADGHWYASTPDCRHVPREQIASGVDPIFTDDFASVIDRIDKIVGVSDDAPLVARVEADLVAAHRDRATIACSQPYYLDITALAANKGDGVAALAQAIGVDLADVTVAGDMPNDLPMFARAGHSIAMGQAPQAVRDAATSVTGPTDEDGLAAAVDRLADMVERAIL
jgi:Cof subfamily protein (haloacid dehalogenase superfamily)